MFTRAEKPAKEWVAIPGTSEHQLGIAVDINADKTRSTNDGVNILVIFVKFSIF